MPAGGGAGPEQRPQGPPVSIPHSSPGPLSTRGQRRRRTSENTASMADRQRREVRTEGVDEFLAGEICFPALPVRNDGSSDGFERGFPRQAGVGRTKYRTNGVTDDRRQTPGGSDNMAGDEVDLQTRPPGREDPKDIVSQPDRIDPPRMQRVTKRSRGRPSDRTDFGHARTVSIGFCYLPAFHEL